MAEICWQIVKEETIEDKVIFNGMELTKMELILAQLRHVFYPVVI
jgi:hypothetical protein